jgi:type II restriction enzyme
MKAGLWRIENAYISGSQSARAWTERWVHDWAFCPNCGHAKLSQFASNRPVADFYCASCNDEYELKSQRTSFGQKVLDGAFRTKCERLAADNNSNLFLMNYDLKRLSVVNLFVVPKHFFVRDIIAEWKPLASTARRAGWIGSHILLNEIPASGKIFLVRESQVQPTELVLAQWRRTRFLREEGLAARGWLLDVMKCVEMLGKQEFHIDDVYAFEHHLGQLYPGNRNVKPKIRQQLQYLRDRGYLDFVSRGYYRLRSWMGMSLLRARKIGDGMVP